MQGPIGSDPGTRWKGELAVCQDLQQFTCLWVLLTEKIRVSVKYGVKESKERLVLSVTAALGPDSGGKKTGFSAWPVGDFRAAIKEVCAFVMEQGVAEAG